MTDFNNSVPDALCSSKAIMGQGHDMGMYHGVGDEEPEDPAYLRKNSIAIQEQQKTLSNRSQWRSDSNNRTSIKPTHITNFNCAGLAMLHIFDELLSKEEKKEENDEKKEEENEGKKEEENEGKKEVKNEGKKGKKSRGAKSMEIHGSRDIFASAPESVSGLDSHSRTSSQLQNTSNSNKCVLDDKSQKNNSRILRSVSHSPGNEGQRSPSCDSTGKRPTSFPTKSRWNDTSTSTGMGLRELCGNNSLDSPSQVEARHSDQYVHNRSANERMEATLPELSNLPDYICEQLDKNNPPGFHQITKNDSLDFADAEFIEDLNETFGITGVQPVFIDNSGYTIWLLDEGGNMYQWCEMQRSLRYMGKGLIDGLTNHFIYPENLCEVMENTGERIPVEEFRRKMKEKAKRIWDNRIILS